MEQIWATRACLLNFTERLADTTHESASSCNGRREADKTQNTRRLNLRLGNQMARDRLWCCGVDRYSARALSRLIVRARERRAASVRAESITWTDSPISESRPSESLMIVLSKARLCARAVRKKEINLCTHAQLSRRTQRVSMKSADCPWDVRRVACKINFNVLRMQRDGAFLQHGERMDRSGQIK